MRLRNLGERPVTKPGNQQHIETLAIKIDLLVFRFSMEAFSNLTKITALELKQDLPFGVSD